jgi:ERCC4-type nuclease
VREAGVETLEAVPGLSRRDAETIRRFFETAPATAATTLPEDDGVA